MQYLDQNEYVRRIKLVKALLAQRPKLKAEIGTEDREVLADYYFAGRSADGVDLTEYRSHRLQRRTTVELEADKAFERLMAKAGLPENLPLR